MDFMFGENESSDEPDETSNSENGKRSYHRHSTQQIHQLEAFFKKCPHPDEKQRLELSKDLGLEPRQVKFWFQNKRTQIKAQAERTDNNALKTENDKLRYENLVMKDALDNLACPTCNTNGSEEVDRKRNLRKLQAENNCLKEEYDRVWNIVAPFLGKFSTFLTPKLGSAASSSKEKFLGLGTGVPSFEQEQMERPSMSLWPPYPPTGIQGMEKSLMLETAATAMEELLELLRVNEPLWIKSPTDGRYFLDHDLYNKYYPKTDHSTNSGAWIESSKDSAIVPMPAANLIEIFLDSKKWMDIFPTIVTKARTIGILDTGSLGGTLHLVYAKLHILSPLVEPREYIFLRYSRQLDSGTWAIADTSYNCFSRLQDASLGSWKLPSGCKIQKMPNEKSQVTWVEHVKVESNSFNDILFKDLIWNCQAFGAKRWLVTLERTCERFVFSEVSRNIAMNRLEGVIGAQGSRKSLMDLSHKMVKSFCEILSTPKRIDVAGFLANLRNSDIQISARENNTSIHPNAIIVCVSTSLWLPIFGKNLFDFFKDEKTRSQWDALSDGSVFIETGYTATGAHPENCITLLKPFSPKEGTMTILQESCFDPLGGLVIYAPIHPYAIESAMRGEDISMISILPSGFVISSDGHPVREDGASTSSNISNSRGSILTMVFQILMTSFTSVELSAETIATLRTFMGTTIARIKAAIGCPNFN